MFTGSYTEAEPFYGLINVRRVKLLFRFCPGVRDHKGITIVRSLLRGHWLAIVYCLVLCSGSCEPVHQDRTEV